MRNAKKMFATAVVALLSGAVLMPAANAAAPEVSASVGVANDPVNQARGLLSHPVFRQGRRGQPAAHISHTHAGRIDPATHPELPIQVQHGLAHEQLDRWRTELRHELPLG